jgi:hypothetical protein
MSAKFIGQGQWVRKVLKNFEELEQQKSNLFGEIPEWPEWVQKLLASLLSISHPGVNVKNIRKWKAKDLGRMLGRQYAGEFLVRGGVPLSSQVIREGERFGMWAAERAKQKRPDLDLDKAQKQFEQGMRVWKPKFTKFIQDTLASACERPYIEASPFFEAFGKAIVIKPDEFLTERKMGVGDKISWTMVAMWEEIVQLHSVGELHRVFEQALKPQGVIVNCKRIEKLCQRIGLKFKGPGRPSGSKTQTNSTSV